MPDYCVWGLSGSIESGGILSFVLDESETFRSQDETRFKINAILKREDRHLELQGLIFYETNEERPATLVLDADYDEKRNPALLWFNPHGKLILQP